MLTELVEVPEPSPKNCLLGLVRALGAEEVEQGCLVSIRLQRSCSRLEVSVLGRRLEGQLFRSSERTGGARVDELGVVFGDLFVDALPGCACGEFEPEETEVESYHVLYDLLLVRVVMHDAGLEIDCAGLAAHEGPAVGNAMGLVRAPLALCLVEFEDRECETRVDLVFRHRVSFHDVLTLRQILEVCILSALCCTKVFVQTEGFIRL